MGDCPGLIEDRPGVTSTILGVRMTEELAISFEAASNPV
jgi:hypothetical protein